MRFQKFLLLVALAAVALAGCNLNDIIVNNPDNHSSGGSTPGASPTPAVPTGSIASVRVSTFGSESCPGGASPATEPNSVRVTCSQPLTCTPLLVDGSQAPPIIHGPAPDSFEVTSGSASGTLLAQGNPFNGDLRGDSAGTVRVRCSVAGISGTLDVSVLP